MSFKVLRLLLSLALISLWNISQSHASLIYDSFNGQDTGGHTSAFVGGGQQITVSKDVAITNIAQLMRMPTEGQLIFHIWDAQLRIKLFQTEAATFGPDTDTNPTWKVSPSFSYKLLANKHYVIGSTGNTERFTVSDDKVQTQNSITSEMLYWSGSGYPARRITPLATRTDLAIRLYAMPEPASFTLVVCALCCCSVGRMMR